MTTTTDVNFTSILIDYVRVSDDEHTSINFPYLSQKDPRWGDHEYDSANQWAGVDNSGIDRWGCAITSTAMILNHYGVTDDLGQEMTPDFLNTWLKSQPDGYIGPGLMNWIAVTRYSKGKVPGEKNSLEFTRSYDPTNVVTPAIFGLPGHFVVVHEEDALNWKINDPANEAKKTLSKTSTIKSINRYVPSNTNLSYMMFVSNPVVNIKIDGGTEYIDNITDDIDGTVGQSTKIVYLAKPVKKDYDLYLKGPKNSLIKAYLYDVSGAVVVADLSTGEFGIAHYVVHYDPNSITEPDLDNILIDLFAYLRGLRNVKSPANGVYQAIYTKFVEYMDYLSADLDTTQYSQDLAKFIAKQSPKHIDANTKSNLTNYIQLIEQD
jgi:hypothetical protein